MGVITGAGNELIDGDALGEADSGQHTDGEMRLFDVRFPDEDDPQDLDYIPSDGGGNQTPTDGQRILFPKHVSVQAQTKQMAKRGDGPQ